MSILALLFATLSIPIHVVLLDDASPLELALSAVTTALTASEICNASSVRAPVAGALAVSAAGVAAVCF